MMECWLTEAGGKRLELPQVLSWRFSYGMGAPCDSFQVECLWNRAIAPQLEDAVGFGAQLKGEPLFTGVVDECETAWNQKGGTLCIHGRGMAALLLDNEAVGADYQVATLADILRDHVIPYAIQTVGGVGLPAVPGFSVENGSSEWGVVERFVRYYGGRELWFDRWGRLVLGGLSGTQKHILGDKTPVTALSLTEKRYGVFSEVLVRDQTGRGERSVVNAAFAQRGGRNRKVLTLPRKGSFEAMRYSAAYQLEQSAREQTLLTLRAAGLCLAWPGEQVEISLTQPEITGIWRVRESEIGVDATGSYTRLVLAGEGKS